MWGQGEREESVSLVFVLKSPKCLLGFIKAGISAARWVGDRCHRVLMLLPDFMTTACGGSLKNKPTTQGRRLLGRGLLEDINTFLDKCRFELFVLFFAFNEMDGPSLCIISFEYV